MKYMSSMTPTNSDVIPNVRRMRGIKEDAIELDIRSWTWIPTMMPAW